MQCSKPIRIRSPGRRRRARPGYVRPSALAVVTTWPFTKLLVTTARRSRLRAPDPGAVQTCCLAMCCAAIYEEARDHARQLAGTPEFERSRNERKKVEMLFAHLKTTMRFEANAPAWADRCQGRVLPRGDRSEPQAHGSTEGGSADLERGSRGEVLGLAVERPPLTCQRHEPDSSTAKPVEFFNDIDPLRISSVMGIERGRE